jgi:hypothetical protein
MNAAIFRQTIFLFDSGMVKAKKILNGRFFFWQEETDVDLNFPVIYYRRVISRR